MKQRDNLTLDGCPPEMTAVCLRILRSRLPLDPVSFEVCLAERDRAFLPIRSEINMVLNDEDTPDRLNRAATLLRDFDKDALSGHQDTIDRYFGPLADILERVRAAEEGLESSYRAMLERLEHRALAHEAMALLDELGTIRNALTGVRQDRERLTRQLAQAKAASETDQLTGVPNRRRFDRILADEIREARSHGHALSVVMVDVDHFKSVNDRFGHGVGDLVLRLVSRTLLAGLRDGDTIARYGGEEFALILPVADVAAAGRVAERLRGSLEMREIVNRRTRERYGRVTASFGAAGLAADDTPDVFVARADKALYRAKREGRNRVEIAG